VSNRILLLLHLSAGKHAKTFLSVLSEQQRGCNAGAYAAVSPGAEAGRMLPPLLLLLLLPTWGLPGLTPHLLLLMLPLLCIRPASLCMHLLPLPAAAAAAAAALLSQPAAALPGLLGLAGLTAPDRKVLAAAAWLRCTLRAEHSRDAARRRSAASSCFTLQQQQRWWQQL
jgi:hypothetical protein